MNESNDLIAKNQSKEGLKKIACVREENYLKELMLNSKCMQRMQDFINKLG
jgi:hypothetical protein